VHHVILSLNKESEAPSTPTSRNIGFIAEVKGRTHRYDFRSRYFLLYSLHCTIQLPLTINSMPEGTRRGRKPPLKGNFELQVAL